MKLYFRVNARFISRASTIYALSQKIQHMSDTQKNTFVTSLN